MLFLLKLLLGFAIFYALLYWLVPPANFVYEGTRLPFWLLKLRKLVKPVPAPEKIKYGKHFRQYILCFKPIGGIPEKQHAVIYIHGSGWQYGRPEMFTANAQWLAGQGYHAFFISHRRIPQCDIRHLREDTALAIKTIVDSLAQNGLSHKKILLSGNSAGANLVALAFLDPSLLATVGLSPAIFSALALLAAPLDLRVMWSSPPLLMLTRMKKAEIFDLANPIIYLESVPKIPILLIHGDADGIVEYQNSVVFAEKLLSLGFESLQFETLKGGMHLDSASWCLEGYECCFLMKKWLNELEK